MFASYGLSCVESGQAVKTFGLPATVVINAPKPGLFTKYKYDVYVYNGTSWEGQGSEYSAKDNTLVVAAGSPAQFVAARTSTISPLGFAAISVGAVILVFIASRMILRRI